MANAFDEFDAAPVATKPPNAFDEFDQPDELSASVADLKSGNPMQIARGQMTLANKFTEMTRMGIAAGQMPSTPPMPVIDSSMVKPAGVPVNPVGQKFKTGAEIITAARNEPPIDFDQAFTEPMLGQLAITPEESIVGLDAAKVPGGQAITDRTGLPLAAAIPLSAVGKAGAGLGQFMTSPSGLGQIVNAATPWGIFQRAKWLYDMAAGTGESAGNLSVMLQKANQEPNAVTPEEWQMMADESANTAAMLFMTGKMGEHEFTKATGLPAPVVGSKANRQAQYLADILKRQPLDGRNIQGMPIQQERNVTAPAGETFEVQPDNFQNLPDGNSELRKAAEANQVKPRQGNAFDEFDEPGAKTPDGAADPITDTLNQMRAGNEAPPAPPVHPVEQKLQDLTDAVKGLREALTNPFKAEEPTAPTTAETTPKPAPTLGEAVASRGKTSEPVKAPDVQIEPWTEKLTKANDVTVQEFAEMAARGKLNKATGAPSINEDGSGKNPLSMGHRSGYSLDDIAHFYLARRSRDVSSVINQIKQASDPRDVQEALSAFDDFAADAAKERGAGERLETLAPVTASKPGSPPLTPIVESRPANVGSPAPKVESAGTKLPVHAAAKMFDDLVKEYGPLRDWSTGNEGVYDPTLKDSDHAGSSVPARIKMSAEMAGIRRRAASDLIPNTADRELIETPAGRAQMLPKLIEHLKQQFPDDKSIDARLKLAEFSRADEPAPTDAERVTRSQEDSRIVARIATQHGRERVLQNLRVADGRGVSGQLGTAEKIPQASGVGGPGKSGAANQPQAASKRTISAAGQKALRELERIFGVRIIPVESADGTAAKFNGFKDSRSNVILIDAHNGMPLLTIAGHELGHHLENINPALYAEMMDKLVPFLKNIPEYRARMERAGYTGRELADQNVLRELVNDFIGDSFQRPDFLQKLAEQEPQIFKRFTKQAVAWLDKLIAKAKQLTGYGVDQHLADLEQARAIVADAMARFGREQVTGVKDEGNIAAPGDFVEFSRKELEDQFPPRPVFPKAAKSFAEIRAHSADVRDKWLPAVQAWVDRQPLNKAIVLADGPDRKALISPEPTAPGNWRTTRFVRGEPWGHMVFNTRAEAVIDALTKDGFKDYDPEAQFSRRGADDTGDLFESPEETGQDAAAGADLNRENHLNRIEQDRAEEARRLSAQSGKPLQAGRQQPRREASQAPTDLASALLADADSVIPSLKNAEAIRPAMGSGGIYDDRKTPRNHNGNLAYLDQYRNTLLQAHEAVTSANPQSKLQAIVDEHNRDQAAYDRQHPLTKGKLNDPTQAAWERRLQGSADAIIQIAARLDEHNDRRANQDRAAARLTGEDIDTTADIFANDRTSRVDKAGQGSLFSRKATETPEFKAWFGQSKVVDAKGNPLVAKHGTGRPDRVGKTFKKSRATSGPMSFFTAGEESGAVASGYATGKADTSLETPDDYAGWFKFKPKGSRSEVNVEQAWWHLTPEQRASATQKLFTTGRENPDAGEGPIVGNSSSIMGADGVKWELQQARGNALKAAKEIWLNSGSLFGSEHEFLDVLKAMGVDGFRLDDPNARYPAVYPVYLKIENPLVTTAMPEAVKQAIRKAGRRSRQAIGYGADQWDKRSVSPADWLERFENDQREGSTHAWTSIPNWVTKTLKDFGYDGIKDTGGKFTGVKHDVWIPFEENQVKSYANRGTFDPAKKNIMFSRKDENPVFRSNIEDALGTWQNKGTAEQLRAHLAKTRGAMDEAEWIGLDDFLKDKPSVTKAEVADFVARNKVDVQEVTKQDKEEPSAQWHDVTPDDLAKKGGERWELADYKTSGAPFVVIKKTSGEHNYDLFKRDGEFFGSEETLEAAQQRAEVYRPYKTSSDTKFENYQLPGGKNYRELLLTLPKPKPELKYPPSLMALPEGWVISRDQSQPEGRQYAALPPGQAHGRPYQGYQYATADEAKEQTRILLNSERADVAEREARAAATGQNFQSSHFDEPNILAHVRFNERTDADGKRVLHLEEVQSDWHQKGRKEGYNTPRKIEIREGQIDGNKVFTVYINGQKGLSYETREAAQKYGEMLPIGTPVPNAPFKQTWPMLAMKRMIRYAADNGFDRITWTTGEQQAARYDLSKQISRVVYDGDTLNAYGLGGENVLRKPGVKESELEDYIGKDAAEKLLSKSGAHKEISGLDLKVGGEGMKGFYDRILPSEVNKFVKKWGGRVGQADIVTNNKQPRIEQRGSSWAVMLGESDAGRFGSRKLAEEHAATFKPSTSAVHSLDITPAMKEAAQQGLPMFSRKTGTKTTDTAETRELEFDGGGIHGPALFSLKAHHGTPHKVDRFSTDKIGTGEGAQVYGWGLYFAENPRVSGDYARNLGDLQITQTSGKWYVTKPAKGNSYRGMSDVVDGPFDSAAAAEAGATRYGGKVGREYTVKLRAEADDLLDWDKPFSEQSPKVQAALREFHAENKARVDEQMGGEFGGGTEAEYQSRINPTGSMVYNRLSKKFKVPAKNLPPWVIESEMFRGEAMVGSDQRASEFLKSKGIRGIRYADQESRSKLQWIAKHPSGGENVFNSKAEAEAYIGRNPEYRLIEPKQTHNFVIFDSNDIAITHENGEPIPFEQAAQQPQFSRKGESDTTGDVSQQLATTPELVLKLDNSRKVLRVDSIEDAARRVDELRERHGAGGEGASTFPNPTVVDAKTGKTVAHISFNGRVWTHEYGHPDRQEIERNDGRGYGKPAPIDLPKFSRKGESDTTGDVSKPLTEQQFYRQYAQHIDMRARGGGDALANRYKILSEGFKKGANVNALPVTSGQAPGNIVERNFMPRAGDVVYLAPKTAWRDRANGIEISDGWKPQPYEAIQIGADNPSMYQEYLRAWQEHHQATPEFSRKGEPAERERSVDEIKADLADAEAGLARATKTDPAIPQKEYKQRAAEAAARFRTVRDELATHPDHVADLILKQHEAISEANGILKPLKMAMTPEDFPDIATVADKLGADAARKVSELADVAAQVTSELARTKRLAPKMADRVTNEMIEDGRLPDMKPVVTDAGRSLDQVTEWLQQHGVDSPRKTLLERFNLARQIADRMQNAKTSLQKAWITARAVGKAALESYKSPPKDDSFRSVIKSWIFHDQRTGLATHQFVQELNKQVPHADRRKAMAVWLDADGDRSLLEFQAGAVPAEYLHIWKLALKLTPGEKALAMKIKEDFAAKLDDGIKVGIIDQGREDYGVPQRWKIKPEGEGDFTGDRRKGSPGRPNAKLDSRNPFFSFQRETPSYFEGIMNKGVPENLDLGHLVSVYDTAFHKTLSSRGMIGALQHATAKDGLPVVKISGSANIAGEGEGKAYFVDSRSWNKSDVSVDGRPYVSIDHSSLKGWKIAFKDEAGHPIIVKGDMLIHPDHVAYLKNELGQSRLREGTVGAIMKPILTSQAFLKASKLSASAFHLMTIGEHMASHLQSPLLHGFKLDLRKPEQALLVRNGLELGMSYPQMAYEEGLMSAHSGLFNKIPIIGEASAKMTDWMFKDYIPAIMMKTGLRVFESNKKRYGKELTDDQIAELTALQMNAAGGLLNYRMRGSEGNMWGRLGADKTWMDLQRLALMAPQFLEARVRVLGQALKPYGHEQRKMLLVQAGLLYVGARILNQLLDEDPHWTDNPTSVVYNGRAYSIRTIIGDALHLIHDPKSFAAGRLSPFGRIGIEAITGRDLRTGARKEPPLQTEWVPGRVAQNIVMDVLNWLTPIPADGILPGAAGKEQTPAGMILSSVGIGSKKFTAGMQMHELANEFNRNSTDPQTRSYQVKRDGAAWGNSDYRKLDALLDAGKLDEARTEYAALMKDGKEAPRIEGRYHRSLPFTGNREREAKFVASLDARQKKIYDQARKDQQARADAFKAMVGRTN